jgi:PKD repeat protein
MRQILCFLLILGVLFFSTSLAYAQIHKVKISELNEKVADESPQSVKQTKYQLSSVNNPLITNSPGTLVGNTYYEYQHNGTMSRMIALDSSKGLHFSWMYLESEDISDNRFVDYNYLDPTGNWLGAVHVTRAIDRGGYTGIAGVLPDGREVLCFHQPIWTGQAAWFTTLGIEKTTGGLGDFYRYDLPDSIPGVGTREFWPKAALDSLNNIHVVMSAAVTSARGPCGYARCHLDDTTLICEAPGIDTVRILPNTRTNYGVGNLVAYFDSSINLSPSVVASNVSKKVAIIYIKYTNPHQPYVSGDVYYIESTNCGQDWISAGSFENIQKHNITNYTTNDTLRAFADLAAVYDYDDNLHILWTTHGYWESQDSTTTDACLLWHWTQATGISLVANGWKPSRPGAFNRTISKMSIGVNPTNNYLYAIWTQFDISDTAANGYSNGEIYASASKDNGLTWDEPKDLTVTPTPGCQTGQCESDHWSSLAEIVNDTLHIQYINDKDAGAAIQQEGAYTNNPVLYFKVPGWNPEIYRVDFSASPKAGFKPLTVEFADSSVGDIISRLWDLGDGMTDTSQNPVHIYNDTGYYTVKLTVSSPGSSYTILKPNYITVLDTLKVDFTAEPTYGHEPLTVSFQSIFNETPERLIWYFGDGRISYEPNPVHEYTEFGNYDVKLVAELCGYKDIIIKEDYIQVSGIKAEFSADKRCGSAPLEVTFSDSSTDTYPITYWHWDFGDGDTSSLQNPTHQFTNTDVFDITLIVSDSVAADTLTKKGYITTQDSVSADFIGLPNNGRSPLIVMFEPVLEGVANQYFWEFGDGDTSSLRNPIHAYTSQGKFDVKLKVRMELDDCNQEDSITKEDYIIVNDLQVKFIANPASGVEPLIVQFADSSTGNPDTWFWDFGDRNTSTQQNPQHQYDTSGFYDVFLRINNSLFADSLLKLDYVHVDSQYIDLFAELSSSMARPGFDLWFYCFWTNIGTSPAENCTLKVLPPDEITFYNVFPGQITTGTYSGYTFSGDTIIIPLQTIAPSNYYGGYVSIYGNLPPTVPIGDTLVSKSWLTSSPPEYNLENNYALYSIIVIGSCDPNDKLASPEGEGSSKAIEPDQRLAYTIQFENKAQATAEAIYIRVVDTLSKNLDWGTLAIGAMSHPNKCKYDFDPYTGVIEWFCDSIMLPPNVNPPAGEGYFTYSISPKKGLPDETEIANTAWIRFDYNEWLQAPMDGPILRTIKYPFIRGDANGDKKLTVSDVIYMINYLFKGGPEPVPIQSADCNCDAKLTVSDVVYLINYLFKGGPAPSC